MMVCLNGVHVEAQGLLSVTTAAAVAFYYASGGAPSPQQYADLKTGKVSALCMRCCVTSLSSVSCSPSVSSSHSLPCFCFSFSYISEFMHLMKIVQDETQVSNFYVNEENNYICHSIPCIQVKSLHYNQERAEFQNLKIIRKKTKK